jgi:hypothetical protein
LGLKGLIVVVVVVVAQALILLYFFLCAGEDPPLPSGDADKGYQWEVWTDQVWVPYWDSHV